MSPCIRYMVRIRSLKLRVNFFRGVFGVGTKCIVSVTNIGNYRAENCAQALFYHWSSTPAKPPAIWEPTRTLRQLFLRVSVVNICTLQLYIKHDWLRAAPRQSRIAMSGDTLIVLQTKMMMVKLLAMAGPLYLWPWIRRWTRGGRRFYSVHTRLRPDIDLPTLWRHGWMYVLIDMR